MDIRESDLSEVNALERIAQEYTQPDMGGLVNKRILSMIVDDVMPFITGPQVLEMGVGEDEWTARILEKIGHTNIVDASGTLLQLSRDKYKNAITTYESLFENFSPPEKFDTIIASYILEHVEDPVQVLSRAASWLADSGSLIAIVPNAGSLHRRLAVSMGMQKHVSDLGETDIRVGHRRVYDIDSLDQDLRDAGYEIKMKRGFFIKLLPQAMMTGFSEEMLQGLMALSKELPIEYATSIAFFCSKKVN